MGLPNSFFIQVTITLGAAQVAQVDFNSILIFGNTQTPPWSPQIRTYLSANALLTDGFTTSSPEYVAAAAIFAQKPSVTSIKVAQQSAPVAQISTITFSGNIITGNTITGQVVVGAVVTNISVPYDTSDAQTLTDLATAIAAVSGIASAVSNGTNKITVTAGTAGIGFTLASWLVTGGASDVTAAIATTTANYGIVDDIAAVQNLDDTWYGLVITSRTVAEVINVADYIETQVKQFRTCSSDANIFNSGSMTDIAAYFEARAYQNSGGIYNASTVFFADAALIGNELAMQPGTYTEAYKTLEDISVDNLTSTQVTNALAKNWNVYVVALGSPGVIWGTSGSGLFFDEKRYVDYWQANVETRIAFQLKNNSKLPYTNQGAGIISNEIWGEINSGINSNPPAITKNPSATPPTPFVNTPDANSQSAPNRAARYFPGIQVGFQLAGAIHTVAVGVNVSV